MVWDKLVGVDIKWDHAGKHCHISMPEHIDNLLLKFKRPYPQKPRLSCHKCLPISYGATMQLTRERDTSDQSDTSDLLDDTPKHQIQEIVGLLLYYVCAVDNKLLVALSAIATKQAKATVSMEQTVHLLLNYDATYPNDGIVYRASNMILCPHANAGFSTNPILAAALGHISSSQRMTPPLNSTVMFSLLPRSSSLL
jgi:hypothetical protein